jgi:hypothetical protein
VPIRLPIRGGHPLRHRDIRRYHQARRDQGRLNRDPMTDALKRPTTDPSARHAAPARTTRPRRTARMRRSCPSGSSACGCWTNCWPTGRCTTRHAWND